jgi:hypothetical protein
MRSILVAAGILLLLCALSSAQNVVPVGGSLDEIYSSATWQKVASVFRDPYGIRTTKAEIAEQDSMRTSSGMTAKALPPDQTDGPVRTMAAAIDPNKCSGVGVPFVANAGLNFTINGTSILGGNSVRPCLHLPPHSLLTSFACTACRMHLPL